MISVAMATFNGEKYIEGQIRSLLEQTVPFDELIICDDCSTDKTINIIEHFDDSRIKIYINDLNVGYINNFYNAVSKTSGDYIFLCDQDDFWEPNKIERMMNFIYENNVDVLCTSFSLIDADGNSINDKMLYQMNPLVKNCKKSFEKISTFYLAFGNVAQGCTYCFTKKVKDIYLKVHNDEVIHDYQIAIIGSIVGKVFFLNEELIKYRIHLNNSVGFKKKNRDIKINKKISWEPFMYRFFREVNNQNRIPHLWIYKILYYFRIPFLIAILRRKIKGE